MEGVAAASGWWWCNNADGGWFDAIVKGAAIGVVLVETSLSDTAAAAGVDVLVVDGDEDVDPVVAVPTALFAACCSRFCLRHCFLNSLNSEGWRLGPYNFDMSTIPDTASHAIKLYLHVVAYTHVHSSGSMSHMPISRCEISICL